MKCFAPHGIGISIFAPDQPNRQKDRYYHEKETGYHRQ
jgi:hypothetical protein